MTDKRWDQLRTLADEIMQREFIDVEKRLCRMLGKVWAPTGMSTETLLTELEKRLAEMQRAWTE